VPDPLSRLGSDVARRLSLLGALARFGFDAARAAGSLTAAGRAVAVRVAINQIRFTAVHAVGLILLLSGILSFIVISGAVQQLGELGVTELIGTLMVVAIVRELGPLLTALVVALRSGTAIAAELATNTVLGEIRALEAMGIDSRQYIVLPRFAASVISLFVLIVLCDTVAIGTGYVAAALNGMSGSRYFEIVLQSLGPTDVWLTAAKAAAFGSILGIVPSYFGLAVRRAPTEIPIAASRANVSCLVGVFLCTAVFVILR
jgi:phospholipid/cholesterol/gamma-HCH transport system permease protein